ncbi:ISAzo13 family transposase [Candidatus Bathycorpusculum sp.]|uniref:ISAzo13 family transposase n=1 Tax=Candidatus Bathycorpusculum sp. TaxID=2994959 RepID=UPI002819AA39|nr:ISAzo13 family transposase [Candidatus Termitimicrobium sp.]MCL2431131.1 ISAzo13 family transposase [Candidatus Termitimicrobium sp.]
MDDTDVLALQARIAAVLPALNEYQRRRYLAIEAKTIGYGGISLVSRLSGVSRQTLTTGLKELDNPNTKPPKQGRSRKSGGGRKPIWETQPRILYALNDLINTHTKDNPDCILSWTNKSLRTIERSLKEQGFEVCYRVVGMMLKMLGYGLATDKKTTTTAMLPDRDKQFEYINSETAKAMVDRNPVLSIDVKKKGRLSNLTDSSQTCQTINTPLEVVDHDFPIPELSRATSFGIYEIFKKQGFTNARLSSELIVFTVESLRKWWYAEGVFEYPDALELVIVADCGRRRYRNHLWTYELQRFVNEIGKPIKILHHPPGTSKWNKTACRFFSFIHRNWQSMPMVNGAVIISLIGDAKTEKRLAMRCIFDEATHKTGRKISDAEFSSINISPADFHGEWNYTIAPTTVEISLN